MIACSRNLNLMRMSLGENMVVTLFGESHGPAVGALIEGIPPNIEIDPEQLIADMIARRPGSGLASKRKETDDVEIMSGVHSGKTTGMPILLLIRNQDVRSKDYSFLPYQPRPGHVDHPINIKTGGAADLRGGGSFSARLAAGLVAAASISRNILPEEWEMAAPVGALNDPKGRKLTNDAFVNGARAAGISGSGPAIAIFVPAVSAQSIERIKRWYSKFDDVELIETSVINAESASMDE